MQFISLFSLFLCFTTVIGGGDGFDASTSPLFRERAGARISSITGPLSALMPIAFVVLIGVGFYITHLNTKARNRVAAERQKQDEAEAQAHWKQLMNSPGYKEQNEAKKTSDKTGRSIMYSMLENSDVISSNGNGNVTALYTYEDESQKEKGIVQNDVSAAAA